jgi:hypothetical protein
MRRLVSCAGRPTNDGRLRPGSAKSAQLGARPAGHAAEETVYSYVDPDAKLPPVTPSTARTASHSDCPIRVGTTAAPAVALFAASNTVSWMGSPVDSATHTCTRVRVSLRTIGPQTIAGSCAALIGWMKGTTTLHSAAHPAEPSSITLPVSSVRLACGNGAREQRARRAHRDASDRLYCSYPDVADRL